MHARYGLRQAQTHKRQIVKAMKKPFSKKPFSKGAPARGGSSAPTRSGSSAPARSGNRFDKPAGKRSEGRSERADPREGRPARDGDKRAGSPRGENRPFKRADKRTEGRFEERAPKRGEGRTDPRGDTRRPDTRKAGRSAEPRKDFRGKPGSAPSTGFVSADAKPFRAPRVQREPQAGPQRLSGTLLWGFHAVRAAWANRDRRVLRLLITDAALESFQEAIDEAKTSGLKRPNAEIIDKGAFERMMPAGAVHQGVVAVVENLAQRDGHDLVASLKPDAEAIILILDQVTDPHNVGAILRSAAAFGASGVIMQDRHAPELSGVLAKTASGAADVIPVAVETNLSRAIEMLQENDFTVVGLDERGEAIGALPRFKRMALVLGAEGSGLRHLIAEHCDTLVSLPTEGAIRSLNVSNAAAVALYAVKASSYV